MRARRILRTQHLLLLAVAAWGCEPSASTPGWAGVVDTLESGVIAVENPVECIWPTGEEWTVTEILRIGSVEGDGPDLFGYINALAVDPAGRIWAYEGQAREIRVFDDQGRFVRTVGRAGEGPEEFSGVSALVSLPSGNLWAIDPQAGRISEIDTAGVFVRSHPISGSYQRFPWAGLVDEDGQYFDVARRASDGAEIVVEYTPEVEPVDTFLVPEYPGGENEFVYEDEMIRQTAGIPFGGRLLWSLEPGRGMWTLQTDEYLIVESSLDGDTIRTIRKAFEPIRVTADQVDAAIERMDWFQGRIDRSRFPDFHAPAATFLRDDRGFIWVLRATGEDAPTEQVWDVFSPDGICQGPATLPYDLQWGITPVFDDGTLTGVVRDELGIVFVVKVEFGLDSAVR